jgi:hypothetical protein
MPRPTPLLWGADKLAFSMKFVTRNERETSKEKIIDAFLSFKSNVAIL